MTHSQEGVQYFDLPRMGNERRDLKDWIEMERRQRRRSSKDGYEEREGRRGERWRGLREEESGKHSRTRQSTQERGSPRWRRRSGVRINVKGAIDERGERGVLRDLGQRSSTERRDVSKRRVVRERPLSNNTKVEDKRMNKYQKGDENRNNAKLKPKRRGSSKPVRWSQDVEGSPTKHGSQQDGALEKVSDEEFEEMLKRNQEYFEAAALPMDLVYDCDQRMSQGEGSESTNETSLEVKIAENKEFEGEVSRSRSWSRSDGEVSSSVMKEDCEDTDLEFKPKMEETGDMPKADLDKTVSVHSSPEVEVMADVETTSEEEEEEVNGAAEQYVDNEATNETRESVEEKLKEVVELRAANLVQMKRLERNLEALKVHIVLYPLLISMLKLISIKGEAMQAGEEEKSLELKKQKLQVRIPNLGRQT